MRVRWLGQEYDAVTDDDWLVAETLHLQRALGSKTSEWGDLEFTLGALYISVKRHLPRLQFDAVSRLRLAELQDCFVADEDDTADEEGSEPESSGDAVNPGGGGSGEISPSTEPRT